MNISNVVWLLESLSVEETKNNFLEIIGTNANCLMLPEYLLCVSVLRAVFTFSFNPHNCCKT